MSATWGSNKLSIREDEARAKHFVRLWGYLAIAGLFLCYVAMTLNVSLF